MIESVSSGYSSSSIEVNQIDYLEPSAFLLDVVNSKAVKKATGILALATIVLSGTFGMAIVKLFQIFDILKFVDVNLPINFRAFIKLFDEGIFDFIPNIFQIEEEGYCIRHRILISNDQDCFVLNSAGSILVQVMGWFMIKGVIMLALMAISNRKQKALK